jgi:hypothetical protein
MASTTSTRPQLSYLSDELNQLKQKGTHFRLRVLDDEQASVCHFDGRKVINLASNNYLGLTTHPKLREAALEATRKYGVGSGAVRTIAGTMRIHMELEERIARFKNVEACVVFQSGFAANAGTVSSILGKDDFIISDELNHASIIDGARLSRAKILVFRHKDMAHAEEQLASVQHLPGHKLLITDGVFSMDGDIGPLPGLCALAEKYGAIMMVDDAHASGVLGRNGRGTVDHSAVMSAARATSSTFSITARVRFSSPRRTRRPSPPPASPPSTCWSRSLSASRSCGRTRASSSRNSASSATTSAAKTLRLRRRRSRRSSSAKAAPPWSFPRRFSKRASWAPALRSRRFPKAKPACAPSSPPPTPMTNSRRRSKFSNASASVWQLFRTVHGLFSRSEAGCPMFALPWRIP